MIKDVAGVVLKEGNLVQVKVGNEWLVGTVHKVVDGGLIVASNPTQKAMTGDKLFLLFEINLSDAVPGTNHAVLRRLAHPDKELIVPVQTGVSH